MLRILALLLLIPLLDIMVLLVVSGIIGPVATVALVVLTGLVGVLLVRAEGRHTIRKIQEKLARGEPPTDELIDGALLVAAGAFLLTPGIVTDATGILFVFPLTRYPIRAALKRWVVTPYIDAKTGGFASGTVYTAGFPGNAEANVGPSGPESREDDTYDVTDDSYDIDDDRE
ncbi:membrane protein FxsA [Halapricum sp. CBA1109]|uniref:FxsA family protein n=1 Tax=Halapricum sp. CBA1109 TaxID=2668068 RepID=UPI0012FC2EE3|nr:FxsA family protein [Halapricum sp. CBA1109]MUV89575.1 membrane protein FxsA [Halapricum sp. CBA1109]